MKDLCTVVLKDGKLLAHMPDGAAIPNQTDLVVNQNTDEFHATPPVARVTVTFYAHVLTDSQATLPQPYDPTSGPNH